MDVQVNAQAINAPINVLPLAVHPIAFAEYRRPKQRLRRGLIWICTFRTRRQNLQRKSDGWLRIKTLVEKWTFIMHLFRTPLLVALAIAESGCGLSVAQLPEVWDASDPDATAHMEMQIKTAIFCELRKGAITARRVNSSQYYYGKENVTSADDLPFPELGAQVTLTLTADEKTSLTPSVSLKDPIAPKAVFGQNVAQSFTMGFGGTLSSQNVQYDKFNFYYTARDLIRGAGPNDICGSPPTALLGPKSASSPFVNGTNLGIEEWLPGAVAVTDFQRSSRAKKTGEGGPLGSGGSFASDSITYDNKFVIVSDGNVTPTWNLVRIGTGSSSLFDLNRTRTHELLITVGPADPRKK